MKSKRGDKMPKRFTDTVKWDDPWFGELDAHSKLFWIFLCDKCDHAGIWNVNMKLAEFHLGFKPDTNALGDRVIKLKADKWHLPKFVDFQYGELNEKNKVHLSVLKILKKHGLCKGLTSPIIEAKEKDKVKDMEEDKVIDYKLPEPVEVVPGYTIRLKDLYVIAAFKKEKGIPYDDKDWDVANISRYRKKARSMLLKFKNNHLKAVEFLYTYVAEKNKNQHEWSFESAEKNCWLEGV